MQNLSKSSTSKQESKNIRAAHREWKTARRKRQCKDYSEMLYWEQMTSCVAL